jgi:hypothetical protein
MLRYSLDDDHAHATVSWFVPVLLSQDAKIQMQDSFMSRDISFTYAQGIHSVPDNLDSAPIAALGSSPQASSLEIDYDAGTCDAPIQPQR